MLPGLLGVLRGQTEANLRNIQNSCEFQIEDCSQWLSFCRSVFGVVMPCTRKHVLEKHCVLGQRSTA
jgi:hypothetical protein